MTSNDIEKMLREKHRDDVFVAECRNGASWTKTHRRLDAWAMNRSWVKLCMGDARKEGGGRMRLKFFGQSYILAFTFVVAMGTHQWATACAALAGAIFAFRWAQLAQWVDENLKEEE